ncbi:MULTISPECIES: dicarboxylate/amino acid:cation symporter [Bradyrhizobium]|jgi:aerobic C4-dicarboxylate transport protein|uniref:Dicarboxylate/amino acid:cation symporter n=3 Tax=Bradyrhizobium TaxID=374 RepID=A0ABS5G8Y3_9BRAD|nr:MULTISPECIES: dicarboxylate/amino acid:cation symporter [Bradyrhizobium]MBR1137620.1 dicarboxylate/amino acid:cation symporter [Bradyrhizobium denitrificans]MDU1493316.1 dicarboxylate/amino acid:cation symporter [Bradyrhizobium sp.]MDU1543728.1 dicarboxylate/amino acid:cation symporter [Bradyrhizobium sp.]MDU1689074.1 dicarboxylate/amino acid:cation symporter [Bradyrhizobium sp.]MDU1807972.1 dicarboxylate/amino acid:cation symporter [Bradyrhizobium sp.]
MAATDVSMAGTAAPKRGLFGSLFFQVVAALVLGILIGVLAPETAQSLRFFSDAFLRLIAMVVAPIVFCVVVHGIASAGDLRKVGRVGVKSLVYFEGMTTIALAFGLVLALVFGPGHGMDIDVAKLDAKQLASFADNAHKLQGGGFGGFILNIIPPTAFDAFARNDVLQVLFFAVIFGVSLALVGEPGKPVVDLIESIAKVLFKAMGLIVRVAPLGVLGAIGFTVGKYGVGSLKQLLALVVLFYVAVALFVVIALGLVMRMAGLSLFKFLRYLKEELLIVLATASSDSVLPQIMRKLEAMGVKQEVVGLVIPTGYSFNLDAFSIYLTLAVVFIAQATNTPLSVSDLLLVLGVSLVTSKGAHGVPGSAIVILAATLGAVPAIPAIGLVLVLSVDWFVGIARAVGNLIGNCVATVVVAAWEDDLDLAKAKVVLDRGTAEEVEYQGA